ncbi:MAG: fibronectin type III domain-containing protein, partial [Fluviicola sp.]
MQKTELRGWKRLKSFVLTLSAFFILNSTFVNSSFAQTYPVQVTPVISGPNLPYLSYYGDQNQHLNLFVLLTDFTAPAQSVRLKLSFTGPNLRFETNPFASSLPIYTLNPGEPLLITGSDLLPYLLEQNLLQTEGNAVDLDKLPEGFYTLCVDVIKNDVNAEILSTNNCRSFYIQEIQPPLLNLPMKFSQVDTTEQIISFLWTQPLNYAPNPSVEIRYHFKLYEWIDTTNFNIFATGQGLVYEEETNLNIQVINTAFDVYLRSGYKYIWQVQAKAYDANTGAFLDLITQNGVSAPFWFNYGEKQSLQATLTNGLTLDLSAQAQNTRKGMAFWTITDETPGEGLSDYEAYIIEYRKFDSTGVNPYDWHSDTLQNKNFDIYQLEPAQAYEVRVSALVGDYRTPILDTARFVTPPQVDYACNSETQPFSQTNYTPLQTAYAGMVFQLGQFELTVSEITALQQVG